jgi:hypothetical protein
LIRAIREIGMNGFWLLRTIQSQTSKKYFAFYY